MGSSKSPGAGDKNEELIKNLDEEKVLEMLDSESALASFTENKRRVQKKLLEDLGLFDVDLDELDVPDDLQNRVEHLRYVNVDSDEQKEYSEEAEKQVEERLQELGIETPAEE